MSPRRRSKSSSRCLFTVLIRDLQPPNFFVMRISKICGIMKWHNSPPDHLVSLVRSPVPIWQKIYRSTRDAILTTRVTQAVAPPRSVPVTIIARWAPAARSIWIIRSRVSEIREVASDKTHSTIRNSRVDHYSQATKRLTRRRYYPSLRSSPNWNSW